MTTFGKQRRGFLFFLTTIVWKKHAAALEAFFSGHFIRTSILWCSEFINQIDYCEKQIKEKRYDLQNTPYNIEFVQELDEKHLAYEKENADFKLAEF